MRSPQCEGQYGGAEKLFTPLGEEGSIFMLRSGEGCTRSVACVKQNHSSIETFKRRMQRQEISAIQDWLKHQRVTVEILDRAEQQSQKRNHYFMEIFPEGIAIPEGWSEEDVARQEQVFIRATEDHSIARNIGNSIVQSKHPDIELHTLTAMTRFMMMLCTQNPLNMQRIHGLLYQGRRQIQERLHDAGRRGALVDLRSIYVEDFVAINNYTTQQIQRYVVEGTCGVVLLGYDHFMTNVNLPRQLAEDPSLPRNIVDLAIETHLLRGPALSDVEILVVEPAHMLQDA